ncbi:hypothetical protein [Roseivivax sp. THAF30]|uniref:hypothetical protein n=1 Tax=Roseivivax sp. THAF30 TaxID=2587852 RepID=UPI001267DB27|nr:hypothetical protein [Roseivivax sp. THAF30]QFT61507.1 hypothetical protein FIU91_01090 [Roseivivax sp. THAF30]
MRWLLALLLFILAACNTGGPGFGGIEPERVSQDGSSFLFRRTGPLIEAQRISPEMMPRFQTVATKAGRAAEARTGCDVAWIMGDQAVMMMALDCPGGPPPPKMPRTQNWSCHAITASRAITDALVSSDISLNCTRG